MPVHVKRHKRKGRVEYVVEDRAGKVTPGGRHATKKAAVAHAAAKNMGMRRRRK